MRIVSDDMNGIKLGMPWSARLLGIFFIVMGIVMTASFFDPSIASGKEHLAFFGPIVVLIGISLALAQEDVEIDFLAQEIRVKRWNPLKWSSVTYPFHTIEELVIEPFIIPRGGMSDVTMYRLCVNTPDMDTMITSDLSERGIERLAERIAERARADILIIEDDGTEEDEDDNGDADTAE